MEKSNVELVNSLRSNFLVSKQAFAPALNGEAPSHVNHKENLEKVPPTDWTGFEDNVLFVPSIDFSQTGLAEPRSQYDITAKLFFLRDTSASDRSRYAEDAIDLVLKQLHMPSLDLLIISYPGISFDKASDCDDPVIGKTTDVGFTEDLDSIVSTWEAIERLHAKGLVLRVGIAELGLENLRDLLPRIKVHPTVDQINLKDICLVPAPLMDFAKQEGIDVLTHSDCTNILPSGTIRELLGTGPKGAGLVLGHNDDGHGLKGDIRPQWVIKYTAVVRDRGVIEDKGYFAMADVSG